MKVSLTKILRSWGALGLVLGCFLAVGSASALSEEEFVASLQVTEQTGNSEKSEKPTLPQPARGNEAAPSTAAKRSCSATTFCPDGSSIFCFGNYSCLGEFPDDPDLCFVLCDWNNYKFCPGHYGAFFCPGGDDL